MKIRSNIRNLIIILIFYLLSYGLILTNGGVYFDDWTLYHVGKQYIIDDFIRYGNPLHGYLLSYLSFIDISLYIYKFISFFCYLASSVFIYKILGKIDKIDKISAFIITLFFMLFPVNFARISLSTYPYALSYFVFFASFWLTTRNLNKQNNTLRIIIPFLYCLSFFMYSLVFFYLVVILYILYHDYLLWKRQNRWFISFLRKRIEFLLLPIIFWVIKGILFTNSGIYSDYNVVTLKRIYDLPKLLLLFWKSFILDYTNDIYSTFRTNYLEIICLSLFVFLCLKCFIKIKKLETISTLDKYFFFLGIIIINLAVLPYLAVGHMPSLYEWTSRHQILLPLGISLSLYYGLRRIIRGFGYKSSLFIISVIISFCIFKNIEIYYSFQKDWFKQLSLISNFRSDNVIKYNTTFFFDDRTLDYNAIKRTYRFYEFNGIFKYCFNDENRFGENLVNINNFVDYQAITKLPRYNMSSYIKGEKDVLVKIENGDYQLNIWNIFYLLYSNYFNRNEFNDKINKIVKLDTQPI